MRYGLGLPQRGGMDLRRDVTGIARAAEAAGYESLWVYERVLYPANPADGLYGIPGVPWIEWYEEAADALTVLTLAAAVTEHVRLGTAILVAPFYSPLHLARALATLDRASGGRVVAGLGSGWSTDEYRGIAADFATRGRALEETIDACRALWGPDPVSYRDSRIVIDEARVSPKPAAPIPVLLGGGYTSRALRRIAEKADGWLPSGLPAGAIRQGWSQILDLAEGYGRKPEDLTLIPRANIFLSESPAGADREPFHGNVAQILDDFAEVADTAADEVIVELGPSVRDGKELLDTALEMFDALAKAGLR